MTYREEMEERRQTPLRRASDRTDCVHCTQEEHIGTMFKTLMVIHEVIVGTPESDGIATQIRRISSQIDKHQIALYGNGKMGVLETTRWMKWALVGVGGGVYSIIIKLAYDYLTKG